MRNKLRDFGHTPQREWLGRTVATGIMRTEKGQICANSDYRKGGDAGGLN